MIRGTVGALLNLLSVFAVSHLLVIATIALIVLTGFSLPKRYSAESSRRLLWLIVTAPWLIGLTTALVVLLFSKDAHIDSSHIALVHWHHIHSYSLVSWHSLISGVFLAWIFTKAVRQLKPLRIYLSRLDVLYSLSRKTRTGLNLLDSEIPVAFTAGLFRPRSFITCQLHDSLDEMELRIVQLHEHEHARRFNPLQKWVFQFLCELFPAQVALRFKAEMTVAMEQCADHAASCNVKDNASVAMTLLKVRRLLGNNGNVSSKDLLICPYGIDDIYARITYLMHPPDYRKFPVLTVVVSLALLVGMCVVSSDLIHHITDRLLVHS